MICFNTQTNRRCLYASSNEEKKNNSWQEKIHIQKQHYIGFHPINGKHFTELSTIWREFFFCFVWTAVEYLIFVIHFI